MRVPNRLTSQFYAPVALILISWGLSYPAQSHCDGLDGPVVTAARKALETEDVNLVLPWVQEAG